MKLSDLRAHDLNYLPVTANAVEAVSFSKFAITLNPNSKFVKVYHKEQSFTVGKMAPYAAPTMFYVVEDSTGIIYRGTLQRITAAIKACTNPDFDK